MANVSSNLGLMSSMRVEKVLERPAFGPCVGDSIACKPTIVPEVDGSCEHSCGYTSDTNVAKPRSRSFVRALSVPAEVFTLVLIRQDTGRGGRRRELGRHHKDLLTNRWANHDQDQEWLQISITYVRVRLL